MWRFKRQHLLSGIPSPCSQYHRNGHRLQATRGCYWIVVSVLEWMTPALLCFSALIADILDILHVFPLNLWLSEVSQQMSSWTCGTGSCNFTTSVLPQGLWPLASFQLLSHSQLVQGGLPDEMVQTEMRALRVVLLLPCSSSVSDICMPFPGLVQIFFCLFSSCNSSLATWRQKALVIVLGIWKINVILQEEMFLSSS